VEKDGVSGVVWLLAGEISKARDELYYRSHSASILN
jgi:hypothetical protein